MEEVAKETDIAFTTDFWTSPMGESFMTMSMHWITWDWHLKTRIMGTISFPEDHTAMQHIREAHGFAFGVWFVSQEF